MTNNKETNQVSKRLESSSPSFKCKINESPEVEYKIYNIRWLVLLFVIYNDSVTGFNRARFSLNTLIYEHWGSDEKEVVGWSMLQSILGALCLIPMARYIDQYGIKKVIKFQGLTLLIGNFLLALSLFDEDALISISKSWRFTVSVIANIALSINSASISGFSVKVANDWFPIEQTTLAFVVPAISYSYTWAISSWLLPKFIKETPHLNTLGYIFIALALIYQIIARTFIPDSKPKSPPSKRAAIVTKSERQPFFVIPLVSLLDTFRSLPQIFKSSRVILPIMTCGLNAGATLTQQTILTNILENRGYSAEFSGQLILYSVISGTIGSMLAAGIDSIFAKKTDYYIHVSRLSILSYTIAYVCFNLSLVIANYEWIIVTGYIITCLLMSLSTPLLIQTLMRNSIGILPDTSILAVNDLMTHLSGLIFSLALILFKSDIFYIPGLESDFGYVSPLLAYSSIIFIINSIYAMLVNSTDNHLSKKNDNLDASYPIKVAFHTSVDDSINLKEIDVKKVGRGRPGENSFLPLQSVIDLKSSK